MKQALVFFSLFGFLVVAACSSSNSAVETASDTTTVSGILTEDQTWSGEVLVEGAVEIPSGITLTISPGTSVKFKHYRGYKNQEQRLMLLVRGTLIAIGEPQNQIWFTSDADSPINGDWSMLRFYEAGDNSILKYAIVEFAQQGINLWHSNVTISHTIVRWNNWEGIYLESYCEPTLEYNLIYQNGYNGIAMEQFNNATIRYSTIFQNGTHGIHIDASTATVENNIIYNNNANELSVDDNGTLTAANNTLSGNNAAFECGEGDNTVTATGNNISNPTTYNCDAEEIAEFTEGEGAPSFEYDFEDTKPYDLGYTPGDEELDQYTYVYPDEDETRRVVKKIGDGLGLTWSVAYDGENIWTADVGGTVYELSPETGEILTQWTFPGPQAWGMAYDTETGNLWFTDFAEKMVYEMTTEGETVSTFLTPDQEGGAKGITTDGEYLYIMGWTTPTIYKVTKSGDLVETIGLEVEASGGIAYDGENFWVPCSNICKFDSAGKLIGTIYAASEGTWDLEWDGTYLWATQRTNENWQDAKVYQLEILSLF